MGGLKRFTYWSFVSVLRVYERLFLDKHVFGRERIPPGPKIYAVNHVSSTDGYWVLTLFPEPVHALVGPGYQSTLAARVLDCFEQINTMPAFRASAVDKAVAWLRRGGAIYIYPEGDVQTDQRLGRFYPGVAKMYRRCPVPIIPIAVCTRPEHMRFYPKLDIVVEERVYKTVMVLRGLYVVNVGEPFMPDIRSDVDEEADNERIMDELKQRVQQLLDKGLNYIAQRDRRR